MFTSNPRTHLLLHLLLFPLWMKLKMLYKEWTGAQFVAKEWGSTWPNLARETGEIEVEMIIEDEVETVQEEGVALNATKRVILLDSALMGIVVLQGTTDGTMIMMAIEGTIPQRIKEIGIAPSHVLTLQSEKITVKPANQTLALVQDPQNVALKREVFRDLTLRSTTGGLMIVAVAVEAAVQWRMGVEVVVEVEVVTRKGLWEEKVRAEAQEVVPDCLCVDLWDNYFDLTKLPMRDLGKYF